LKVKNRKWEGGQGEQGEQGEGEAGLNIFNPDSLRNRFNISNFVNRMENPLFYGKGMSELHVCRSCSGL
jgi:hypothetical protein